jgi:hypothetical protein
MPKAGIKRKLAKNCDSKARGVTSRSEQPDSVNIPVREPGLYPDTVMQSLSFRVPVIICATTQQRERCAEASTAVHRRGLPFLSDLLFARQLRRHKPKDRHKATYRME